MKPRFRQIVVVVGLLVATMWWHFRPPKPTVLAFLLGQTFEQLVRDSSYPVIAHSNRPADDPGDHKFGATWVEEPAVIIRFTDPEHGFTLPPTKFAALTFSENPGSLACHIADAGSAPLRGGRRHSGEFAEPVQIRRLGTLEGK